MEWFKAHAVAAAAVAAAVLTLILLWQKAVWPLARFAGEKTAAFLRFWKDLVEMPGTVRKELRTNGGQSLKDVVRRLERFVLNNEAKARILLDQSNVPTFEAEPNKAGHIRTTWVNKAYSRAFGLGVSEIQAGKWTQQIHVDDRDRVAAEWEKAVSAKRDFFCEWRFESPSGRWLWCTCRAYPTLLPCGTIGAYIGFAEVHSDPPD